MTVRDAPTLHLLLATGASLAAISFSVTPTNSPLLVFVTVLILLPMTFRVLLLLTAREDSDRRPKNPLMSYTTTVGIISATFVALRLLF